jgi:hypothetical protein
MLMSSVYAPTKARIGIKINPENFTVKCLSSYCPVWPFALEQPWPVTQGATRWPILWIAGPIVFVILRFVDSIHGKHLNDMAV